MTEQTPDPVEAILRATKTSDRVRAAAWDAVYLAVDDADLERRLGALPLPDDVKAQLFDARGGSRDVMPAPMAPMASHETPPLRTPRGVNMLAMGPGAIPPSVDMRPVGQAYLDHGPKEVVAGVTDIGQGNLARGARRALGGAAVASAPFAIPALASAAITAPVATGTSLLTGLAAREGVRGTADALGATEDQAGLAGDLVGMAAGGAMVKHGPRGIPSRGRAGEKFQEVMNVVGDRPVDLGKAGDSALRIMQLAERGGTMPKVVRDFLRRATDPTKGEPNYREMRDFYSNISRLSADEMKRLPPVIKKELGELRVALNDALAQTAARGGQERVYRAAMREYAIASRMREMAEKMAKYGAGIAGAGAAYNMFKD